MEGIAYNGTAPDLGAYEKETGTTGIKSTVATEETNNLRITTTMGGRVMLTVCNASGTQHFKAIVYDENGRLTANHDFVGTTTMLPAIAGKGIFIIRVENGNGWKATAKIAVR